MASDEIIKKAKMVSKALKLSCKILSNKHVLTPDSRKEEPHYWNEEEWMENLLKMANKENT